MRSIATRTAATIATTALLAAGSLFTASTAAAESPKSSSSSRPDLYVLTDDGWLSRHNGHLPLLVERRVKVRGLASGDRLVGIDLRPATKDLYGLSTSGQLYRIDSRKGRATKVGTPATAPGKAIGFDFNPTVDRIRVVTARGVNQRLNPDTGAVAGVDTNLAYAAGDRAAGRTPRVAASGYTDSVAGAATTASYGIDSARDALVLQGSVPGAQPVVSPNTGQLFTVGKLGRDVSTTNGFDIAGQARKAGEFRPSDYTAVAAVQPRHSHRSILVKVDLRDGSTSRLFTFGLGTVVGLTFAAQ